LKVKVGRRYRVRTAQDTIFLAFESQLVRVEDQNSEKNDTRLFFDNGVELAMFEDPSRYMVRVKTP
jgi:hypothetical protein